MYLLLALLLTTLQLAQAVKPTAYNDDEFAKCGIGIGNKAQLQKSSHELTSSNTVKKILGNRRVDSGAMPWMVSIRTRMPGIDYTSYCSGTLISSKYVLTAAHCFMYIDPKTDDDVCKPANFNQLQVDAIIGATDLRDGSPQKYRGVTRRVVRKKMDEKFYAGKCKFNDMLETEVPVDKYPPICLLDRDEAATKMGDLTTIKENVYISGYGDTPESNDNILYHGMIAPVVPCRGAAFTGNDAVCSEMRKGRGACDGDSGGPLAVLLNNRYYIYGVFSRGDDCQTLTKQPGLMQFERVAPKMAKVRQHINK